MAQSLGNYVVSILGDSSKFDRMFKRVQRDISKGMKKIGKASAALGKGLLAVGGAALGGFAIAAKTAADFGSGMAKVSTLGVTNLEALGDGIRDLAKEFGLAEVPTQELYDTISAGVSQSGAVTIMRAAMLGAKGGVGELSSALDAGTSILNAFGKNSEDAAETTANFTEIQGQLVTAIKFGKTNMDELGGAVGRAASLMSEAGISSEEFLAAIAAITTTGVKATEAVSGLKAVVANIIKPSETAAKVAKALGIQFDATALKTKGLGGFLADMRQKIEESQPSLLKEIATFKTRNEVIEKSIKKLEGLSKRTKDQSKELATMREELALNRKSLKELDPAVGTSTEVMGRLVGSIEGLNIALGLSSGDVKETFEAAMADMANASDNLKYASDRAIENDPALAFDKLKASLHDLAIEIGTNVNPVLTELIDDHLQPLIDKTGEWLEANREFVREIAPTVLKVSAFATALGAVLVFLPGVVSAVIAIGAPIVLVAKVVTALALAINPAAPLVLGFGLIVIALVAIVESMRGGTNPFEMMVRSIKPLQAMVEKLFKWLFDIWELFQKIRGAENVVTIGDRTRELLKDGRVGTGDGDLSVPTIGRDLDPTGRGFSSLNSALGNLTGALQGGAASAGRGGTTVVVNAPISITGDNPQEIAREVLSGLTNRLQFVMRGIGGA